MLLRLMPVSIALLLIPGFARGDDLPRQAASALTKAVDFLENDVSTEGGFLWQYSADLQTREGEGKADDQTVWVQPPGTPSVGMALLEVHRATGEERYLAAAVRAGRCLVRGQLESGGWDYRICFDPDQRKRYAYRADGHADLKGLRDTTTLDDNTTQAALRLLMELDRELEFQDEEIHEAATYALQALLDAQYPNGAWPQRFSGPIGDPAEYPVKKASYPETWSRVFPGKDYKGFYTLNDNAMADVIDVMFHAHRVYGEERYFEAAKRGGDFFLLARMPEPQPAWAQQYDLDMHPAWARKFEPPAVTGGESRGAMETLIDVYIETGDRKYLAPIPRAIEYLEASRLDDGRLARFYELETNRPLYFTIDYRLTYSDADMPTHYAFKIGDSLRGLRSEYEKIAAMDDEELTAYRQSRRRPRSSRPSDSSVRAVIDAMDDRGAWVEEGRLKYWGDDDPTRRVIRSSTFANRIGRLGDYLASVRNSEKKEP